MSDRTDKDLERSTDEALDRLAEGWDPLSSGAGDDIVAHLEALALLAYAVEPQVPSPAVKAGLLHAVAAEPRTPVARQGPRPVLVLPSDPVDVTLRHIRPAGDIDPADMTLVGLGQGDSSSAAGPAFDVGDVREIRHLGEATMRHGSTAPPRPVNSNTPLYLLAAGLVFCLVGLGYLYGQLQSQNAQSITRQTQLEAQVERARSETDSIRARVQMVTDVARVAYPMQQVANTSDPARTVGRPGPGEVRPDGIVYVCGQHQRWYLSLSGFEPAPEGKAYHLWFKTENGAVDAGPIELGTDGRADVSQLTMPEGTQGFMVSLEDSAEAAIGEPHGQIILKGEQPVML